MLQSQPGLAKHVIMEERLELGPGSLGGQNKCTKSMYEHMRAHVVELESSEEHSTDSRVSTRCSVRTGHSELSRKNFKGMELGITASAMHQTIACTAPSMHECDMRPKGTV